MRWPVGVAIHGHALGDGVAVHVGEQGGHVRFADGGDRGMERQAQVDVGAAARAQLPGGTRQQVGAHRAQRRRKVDVAERRSRRERPGMRIDDDDVGAEAADALDHGAEGGVLGRSGAGGGERVERQADDAARGRIEWIEAQVGGDVAQAWRFARESSG